MGGYLRGADYERAFAFVERLHSVRDADLLPGAVLRALPVLVGTDHITWNDMALSVPRVHVVEYPLLPGRARRLEEFPRLLGQHPGLQHFARTGDLTPTVLSDFVSARELHQLELYDRVYRSLGYEDQMGLSFTAPRPTTTALALGRAKRGFSRRDRAMAALLRPHMAVAHRNAAAYTRARRRLRAHDRAESALGVCVLELDAEGRFVDCPPRAARWLDDYFEDRRGGVDRPPATLATWIRRQEERGARGRALVRRRGDTRLVVRLFTSTTERARCLLLEEQSTPRAAPRLRRLGLTPREIEVLLQVERGARNDEIAAALYISPRTVKKHLENIFRKLGVTNRTAAAARLRGDD